MYSRVGTNRLVNSRESDGQHNCFQGNFKNSNIPLHFLVENYRICIVFLYLDPYINEVIREADILPEEGIMAIEGRRIKDCG